MIIKIDTKILWLFLGMGLVFLAGLWDAEIGYWSFIPFLLGGTILWFLIDKPKI